MRAMSSKVNLQSIGSPVFWGEIAPCEHIAQFYARTASCGHVGRIRWWGTEGG